MPLGETPLSPDSPYHKDFDDYHQEAMMAESSHMGTQYTSRETKVSESVRDEITDR